MIGAAVGKIVAIDRRDDDMIETEFFDGQRHVARLFGIERQRLAFVDGAKTAAARAGVAENQKRRGLVAPALADIRTARLLTDRVKIFLAHQVFEPQIVGITWRFDFDPVGMSSAHKIHVFKSFKPFTIAGLLGALDDIVITEDFGEVMEKSLSNIA